MILQLLIPFYKLCTYTIVLGSQQSYDQDLALCKDLMVPLWYASCLGSLDYEHILNLNQILPLLYTIKYVK